MLGGVDFSNIKIPLRAGAPGQEPVAMAVWMLGQEGPYAVASRLLSRD